MTWDQAILMLALADGLEQDVAPRERATGTVKFNMKTWFKGSTLGELRPGITACALGWAATLIRESGITLALKPDRYTGHIIGHPTCQGFEFEGAGAEAFGLTEKDAEYLFCSEEALERTIEEEIEALREHVAQQWDAGCALENPDA